MGADAARFAMGGGYLRLWRPEGDTLPFSGSDVVGCPAYCRVLFGEEAGGGPWYDSGQGRWAVCHAGLIIKYAGLLYKLPIARMRRCLSSRLNTFPFSMMLEMSRHFLVPLVG